MSVPEPAAPPRYGRYVGLLALLILVLITVNTIVTKPNGDKGIELGHSLPPFAVPLALGDLVGDADVATSADQGARGRVPACQERGPQILNVCQLYERGPVVLALFVDSGSCSAIVSDLQALAPSFPGVQFAAVAIKGERAQLRRLVRTRGLSLPVGIDRDGALAALYKVASCPQVTFAYPGGLVQSRALLSRPAPATLRARVAELVAASRARGWRG
ncbi:MAG: TlpA family protein disulfide reductase [Solirubrobacterales bacterium]